MDINFETDYDSILKKIDNINPIEYCKSRNYIDGAVTYLSPYISRGVISTKQVLQTVFNKGYAKKDIEHFIKELCWRDYFQRVAQVRDINIELKQTQADINNHSVPQGISKANTGIDGIDRAILELYQYGYMHNHCRMYTASVVCNIAKSHWLIPAKWMYYHLLDGDWASNACSWQWVAGANSNKKYYANQENINRYTYTNQKDTYLDASYEDIVNIDIPEQLLQIELPVLETKLPESTLLVVDYTLPTYIFNYYNLDPNFGKDIIANKILLIEPDFFDQYPISENCMNFMLDLSKNISGIQIYVGSFDSLKSEFNLKNIYYKEHPFNANYSGTEIERDWIVKDLDGYSPSFFSYWKKIEKHIQTTL